MIEFLNFLKCCLPCVGNDDGNDESVLQVLVKSKCFGRKKVVLNINSNNLTDIDIQMLTDALRDILIKH